MRLPTIVGVAGGLVLTLCGPARAQLAGSHTLGDYGVFGFYPNKQITTGEGGLIVTNDDAADALRYLVATKSRTVAQRKLRGL